jgi:hypothetical protein
MGECEWSIVCCSGVVGDGMVGLLMTVRMYLVKRDYVTERVDLQSVSPGWCVMRYSNVFSKLAALNVRVPSPPMALFGIRGSLGLVSLRILCLLLLRMYG